MSIQNDWKKCLDSTFHQEFNGLPTFTGALRPKMIRFISKLIADARKEVIKRIEAIPDKDVRPEITVWLESREFCLGYNEALKDVLATLKEEEK